MQRFARRTTHCRAATGALRVRDVEPAWVWAWVLAGTPCVAETTMRAMLTTNLEGKPPALTDGCELVSAGLAQPVGDFAAMAVAWVELDQAAPAASSEATARTRAL